MAMFSTASVSENPFEVWNCNMLKAKVPFEFFKTGDLLHVTTIHGHLGDYEDLEYDVKKVGNSDARTARLTAFEFHKKVDCITQNACRRNDDICTMSESCDSTEKHATSKMASFNLNQCKYHYMMKCDEATDRLVTEAYDNEQCTGTPYATDYYVNGECIPHPHKNVRSLDVRVSWTGKCGGASALDVPNGPTACEGHGYGVTQCMEIGCCKWNSFSRTCQSDVGKGLCEMKCDAHKDVCLSKIDCKSKKIKLKKSYNFGTCDDGVEIYCIEEGKLKIDRYEDVACTKKVAETQKFAVGKCKEVRNSAGVQVEEKMIWTGACGSASSIASFFAFTLTALVLLH